MMNKKMILPVLFTAILLAGCTTNEKQETKTIRYGGQYYPGEFLLKGQDFWSKYDIKVEHTIFSSGSENNEALISNNIDINVGSDSKTNALFTAIPDKALVIGTIQKGDRYTTIIKPDSNIKSWEELKGKTVATRFGTGAEAVLRRYYEENGLKWEDFNYVNMNVEDMPQALESGQIEAFTAWSITPEIAEANDVGKPLMSYGDIALVPVSIHTTKEFAEEHEDLVVKFLAAQMDKAEYIKQHPKQAAEIAAQAAEQQGIQVSSEAFEKAFDRINFEIELNKEIITAIEDTGQFLKDQGKIDNIPQISYDTRYIEKARELHESKKNQ